MNILHQCIFYINVYFNVKKINKSSKNCSKFIQVPILVEKSKNYTIPKTKMQLLEEWLNNVGGEVTARNVGWILLTFLILLEAMFNFIHVLFCSMVKWLTSIVRQFLDLNTILRQLYVNLTSIVRQFHVNLTSIVRQFPTFAFFAAVNFTSIIRQLHVNYFFGVKLEPNWLRFGVNLLHWVSLHGAKGCDYAFRSIVWIKWFRAIPERTESPPPEKKTKFRPATP